MSDPKLQFNPVEGWNNSDPVIGFPTNPSKEATRGLFQKLHDQTRDFINNTLIKWINETFATRAELSNVVVGTIPEGTYATPADVTAVRELHTSELTAHANNASHVAAKIYAYKNIGGVM